uniref:Reverse transcriptase Ty1/copia-type domain-containing protein n=1 Tax=Cajanus cajan TaxID=3821 RepID=A0A151RZ98_CAJCA|nr:hypothetical protein KK1_030494 [Cajanus cajan]
MREKYYILATKEGMKALEKNSTREIVNKPKDKKVGRCKWKFTVKNKTDGTLDKYKARLVAKGYSQTYGTGYETFALVAKMNTNWLYFLLQLILVGTYSHGCQSLVTTRKLVRVYEFTRAYLYNSEVNSFFSELGAISVNSGKLV